MTLKEAFKDRYSNGNRHDAIMRVLEGVIIAVTVALGGILWGSLSAVPKIEAQITSMQDNIKDIKRTVGSLDDCVKRHLEDSISKRR